MSKLRKHRKWLLPAVGIIVVGAVFGYLKLFTWNPERQKLAMVNDRVITVGQFGREIAKVPAPYQAMLKEEPKDFLEQLILKEVLLQEAIRQGVKGDPSAKGEEAEMALILSLLKKEVLDKVKVEREEVEEIYRQHRDQVGKKSLAEVTPFIESAVREVKGKEKMMEFIFSLKKQAKIEIDEKRLRAIAVAVPSTNTGEELKKALLSGQPVLADFGANSCVPCRQIRPILKEIGQEYSGKAHVLIIDVYQYPDLAREYRVQLIPTLIFFNGSGKEIFRHLGAWDKASIINKLKEAGAA